jgi:hypothetical protein
MVTGIALAALALGMASEGQGGPSADAVKGASMLVSNLEELRETIEALIDTPNPSQWSSVRAMIEEVRQTAESLGLDAMQEDLEAARNRARTVESTKGKPLSPSRENTEIIVRHLKVAHGLALELLAQKLEGQRPWYEIAEVLLRSFELIWENQKEVDHAESFGGLLDEILMMSDVPDDVVERVRDWRWRQFDVVTRRPATDRTERMHRLVIDAIGALYSEIRLALQQRGR